jgi:hypothetical protein
LRNDLLDCSLNSSSFSSRPVYLEGHRLQHEVRQPDRRLYPIVVIKELYVTYNFSSQIISYILNMLICVCMILLDNLLQYFLFITMIDLLRSCDSTANLICIALAKIKLKILLFSKKLNIHSRTPPSIACSVHARRAAATAHEPRLPTYKVR